MTHTQSTEAAHASTGRSNAAALASVIRRIGQRSNASLVCMLALQYRLEDGLETVDIAARLNLASREASADERIAAVQDASLILERARDLIFAEAPWLAGFLDSLLKVTEGDAPAQPSDAAASREILDPGMTRWHLALDHAVSNGALPT